MSDTALHSFQLQFDSQEIFLNNQNEYGALDPVDLNYLGDAQGDGRVSVRGIEAKLQEIYLYFGSLQGDYLRSDMGGPFSFAIRDPGNEGEGIQFRIITTANLILSSRYPEFDILDIQVDPLTKIGGAKGWKVTIALRHESVDENIIMNITV